MLRWACVPLSLLLVIAGCSRCSSPESSPAAPADAANEETQVDASPDVLDASVEDAAEDVYGSEYDDGTFLTDKSIWSPVPNDNGCGLFQAKVVPNPFPATVWEPCGPGCLVAPATWATPLKDDVIVSGATAGEREGEIFLRVQHDVASKWNLRTSTISRLDSGEVLAAAQVRNSSCGNMGWANDASLVFIFRGGTKQEFALRGGVLEGTSAGAAVTWGRWLPHGGIPGSTFSWDEGWGVGSGSRILASTSPTDTKLRVIDPKTNEFEVAGRGKLVVWETGKAIKSYTSAGGLKYLWAAAQGYVNSVSSSDTKLVWIVVDGPDYLTKYRFETARLYWSPLSTDPSRLTVTEGPLLSPATGAFYNTRTGGDFAASKGCYDTAPNEGVCPIFVVQLSTGKVWKIPPRPGSAYQEVMAVSQSTILVSESDWPGTPSEGQHIRRFVRFATSDLTALETAW